METTVIAKLVWSLLDEIGAFLTFVGGVVLASPYIPYLDIWTSNPTIRTAREKLHSDALYSSEEGFDDIVSVIQHLISEPNEIALIARKDRMGGAREIVYFTRPQAEARYRRWKPSPGLGLPGPEPHQLAHNLPSVPNGQCGVLGTVAEIDGLIEDEISRRKNLKLRRYGVYPFLFGNLLLAGKWIAQTNIISGSLDLLPHKFEPVNVLSYTGLYPTSEFSKLLISPEPLAGALSFAVLVYVIGRWTA